MLFSSAPPASADIELCPPGEGAGECGAHRGLAVDTEEGLLYVADETNNRINVFEVDGDFKLAFGWGVDTGTPAPEVCTTATGCQKGIAGNSPGQLDRPVAVAVDNDPSSPSQHAIYVSELGEDEGPLKPRQHPRIQKFEPDGEFVWMIGEEVDKTDNSDLCTQAEGHVCGKAKTSSAEGGFSSVPSIATGPGGVLYAVDNIRVAGPGDKIKQRLQRFEPSGAQIPSEVTLLEGTLTFALAIAVDGAGNLWVTSQSAGLRKYCSPTWALCAGPFETGANFARNSLTIDAATGTLYAGQHKPRDKAIGNFNVVTVFDPATGNVIRRFAYTEANGGGTPINGLAAHSSAFGDIFISPTNDEIAYVFEPPPGPVPAPPSLEVKDVGSTKATLVAEVNPEGEPTTVHFEYLSQEEFEDQGESFTGPATKETTPQPLGTTDFELKTAEALIGCLDPASEAELPDSPCLEPETTYRWRVVAEWAGGEEGPGPVEGPAFETKSAPELGEIWATRVGTDTARLNAEVNPTAIPTTGFFEYVDDATFQASGFAEATKAPNVDEGQAPLDFGSGDAFVTRSVTIFPLTPGTLYHYRLVVDSVLIDPTPSEAEELRTFAAPQIDECPNDASRIGPAAFLPDCRAYEMVSPPDKEGGDIRVLRTTVGRPAVLEQSAVSGERLAYGSLRSFGGAASGPYTSQYIARRVDGKAWETHPINPPRGRPIFTVLQQSNTEFKAFSADLCDTWLTTFAEPPLAPGALAGYSNLYRRTDELCSADGNARYETLAPINPPASFPPGPNFNMQLLGVSADGEHAAFAANDKIAPEASVGQTQLYEHRPGTESPDFACILPGGEAVSGSCTAGSGAPGDSGPQIGRISDDGERIFWSAAASGEGELFVRIAGTETVAVSKEGEEGSGTSGSWFWGAARDGSVAIFSTEVAPNNADLYRFEVDTEETELIAEDVLGVLGISEDASRVYFASSEVLTGAEANSNGDVAQAGKANLYLREGGGGIEFVATLAGADLTEAISAEPSRKRTSLVTPDGAHATFVSVAPLTGYDNKSAVSGAPTQQVFRYDAAAGELICVSCNPSGARPAGRSSIPFWQTPMHAARVLTADGSRLYFESADVLAARDSNGTVDVYQWEEPGSGGCDPEDGSFSPEAGGCIDLVSSGLAPQDSRFVEASPSGNDVFFATVASLLPQDSGVFDIYDARVGGGLPIPPTPPPPCEGDTCAAQVQAPEAPTPASSEYVAPPSAPQAKPAKRRCAKGKRRVTRKGKVRCVAKKKKRRAKR